MTTGARGQVIRHDGHPSASCGVPGRPRRAIVPRDEPEPPDNAAHHEVSTAQIRSLMRPTSARCSGSVEIGDST